MSLSPAQFSGETSGANARMADPSAMSQQELGAVAEGNKVSGGRRRRRSSKARKTGRKSGCKTGRRSVRRRSRRNTYFMM